MNEYKLHPETLNASTENRLPGITPESPQTRVITAQPHNFIHYQADYLS